MLLLCAWFVQCEVNPWTLFESERELLQACAMCTKYVRMRKSPSSLQVAANEECASPDTTNRFCRLMRFINQSSDPSVCSNPGPCVPQTVPSHRGTYCYSCRFVSSFLMLFESGTRLAKVQTLCAGSRSSFSEFCTMLDSQGIEAYVAALNRANSPMNYCIASKMCKKREAPDDL